MNIAKLMIPKVFTACLRESDTVRQGLELMTHRGYSAIPVLDDKDGYVGSITEGDFLRHILATGSTDKKYHEKCSIRDIYRKDFCPALYISAEESEVMEAIMNQNFVPIIDDRNVLCGILTRKRFLEYLSEKIGAKG